MEQPCGMSQRIKPWVKVCTGLKLVSIKLQDLLDVSVCVLNHGSGRKGTDLLLSLSCSHPEPQVWGLIWEFTMTSPEIQTQRKACDTWTSWWDKEPVYGHMLFWYQCFFTGTTGSGSPGSLEITKKREKQTVCLVLSKPQSLFTVESETCSCK